MSALSDMEARVQAAVAEEQRQGQAQEKGRDSLLCGQVLQFRGERRRSAPLRTLPGTLRLCS